MKREEVAGYLQKFERCRVLVVGDLMLDEYLWGHVQRVSPEAPVPILGLVRQEQTLGGAGNVVKNLRSLGAQVWAHGVVGLDQVGQSILRELDQLGTKRDGVVQEAGRTSTRKSRLMSLEHGSQVFRFDQESAFPIQEATKKVLLDRVAKEISNVDAVLCSDYLKGVLTQEVLERTITLACQHTLPVVISPKDSDARKYRRASVLIPNQRELEQMSGVKIEDEDSLAQAAMRLIRGLEVPSVLITRGAAGMALFEEVSGSARRVDIRAVARSVYDVTGAGDTVASVFTLAIAAGAGHEAAARLANFAAGIVVEKRGTAWVTPQEILERMEEHGALQL